MPSLLSTSSRRQSRCTPLHMAERTDRTKCPSPKKPAVLLLYTLCFSALFATASASDSLSGRDAGSAASEVLSHPIAASTSVHGTGGALDRSASSSGSARAILQVDSSQPQQAAVKKDATAGKPQAPVEPRQPAGGAPPAEDAFDPYNDYELYTKVCSAKSRGLSSYQWPLRTVPNQPGLRLAPTSAHHSPHRGSDLTQGLAAWRILP